MIAGGRPATQMQGFSDRLPAEAIEALVQWIYTPASPPPQWTEAQILASRIVHHATGTRSTHGTRADRKSVRPAFR